MSDEDKDDRQHEPTEQKLRRAREKGDIVRSPEIGVALSYLGMLAALTIAGAWLLPQWQTMAARALGAEPWPARGAMDLARGLAGRSASGCCGCRCSLAGQAIARGLRFTPSRLVPDLKKINPIKNAAQKFGRSGLTSFALSLAKVALVAVGGWFLFARLIERISASGGASGIVWVSGIGLILREALMLALQIAAVFALIDYVFKWFEHRRRNRMTRRELRDEHKDSEGDPHLKQARRQRAVDIALSSMLADVENADVVIVNPTHYAVALAWKRGSGRAPVCVAKGVDAVAARIRERAKEHGVPIWSDPPCARAIHAAVAIGAEIEREHFGPVAAAIRFAEAMRVKARRGWGGAVDIGGAGRR